MPALTDADDIELEAFYNGAYKQDWAEPSDHLEIDRWSKYGHDRLYINDGIAKADKYDLYVDLQTHEIVSNNEAKHSGGTVEITGDTATITIEVSGGKHEHEITVSLSGEAFAADNEGDGADGEAADEETADGGSTGEHEIVTDGGQVEVEYDGQTVTVPTMFRKSDLSNYYGSVPDSCPVEHVYVYDGRLRAEAQIDETTAVVATYRPDRVDSIESGWDGWSAEFFDKTGRGTPPNTLWERDSDGDGGGGDTPDAACDGGEVGTDRVTDYVDDAIIEDALAQHGDPGHPEALTVDDVRELLAHVQYGVETVWGEWLDSIERTDTLVVAQDDGVVVLDTGERDAVCRALEAYDGPVTVDDTAERVVSSVHHRVAEQIDREYSWGVTYPLVVRLPADGEAGQRFVEAAVNGLQRRGLAPGQAWAYYGVAIRGESRNAWGARKGDADHKNVSDALDKATQTLPEA
jgi:hypothetical protein